METIVITGARGRIAQCMSKTLKEQCVKLIRVSRTSDEIYLSHKDAFDGDIFSGSSIILHAAWSSVPATSESSPGIEWITDLPFLASIFHSIRNSRGIKPLFVFFSSAGAVYGNAPGRPCLENDVPSPISWYGQGKVAAESLCKNFAAAFDIPLLILRISNPYGMYSNCTRPQGLIPRAIDAAISGRPLDVWGDGSAIKDFLHIEDFRTALVSAINSRMTGTYNVGYGQSYSVKDVLQLVERLVEKSLSLNILPSPPWDVTDSRLDCNAFCSTSGWSPIIDLEMGIKKCIEDKFLSI